MKSVMMALLIGILSVTQLGCQATTVNHPVDSGMPYVNSTTIEDKATGKPEALKIVPEVQVKNTQTPETVGVRKDATAQEIANTYAQIAETVGSLKDNTTAQEVAKTYAKIAETVRALEDNATAQAISKVTYVQIAETIRKLKDDAKNQEIPQITYSQVAETVASLNKNATAQEIADVLTNIEAVNIPDQDRPKVAEIEVNLLARLRAKVKSEASDLHNRALKASSYRDGYALARNAGVVIALYPLSDATSMIKEAEDLSFRQNEVMHRLELIRRQRYNHWAAKQAEKALKVIREKGKDSIGAAIAHLRTIEPSLLESSVASLYSYAASEIMDKLKKDAKATVAKELTNTSATRRSLEDF